MKFVNLHSHDSMSIGDGLNYPEDHYNFIVENAGEESLALATTNHGNINSFGYMLQARDKLRKKGINFKTIVGNEMYLHPDLDEWKKAKESKNSDKEDDTTIVVENESETKDKSKWYDPVKRRHHLVVLAQNEKGLENLFKLTSWSYINGFYRYPRVDFKILEQYNEGLIISTACLGGLGSYIILRDLDKGDQFIIDSLDKELKPLLDIFGKERAFLEIQFNGLPEQKIVNHYLTMYSKLSGYKLITTADAHYARPEFWKEREMYKLLSKQSQGWNVSAEDLPSSKEDLKCELYQKNGQQMFDTYLKYNPELDPQLVKESIERTYEIAHCQIEDVKINSKLKLPSKNYTNPFKDLQTKAWKAFEDKGFTENDLYKQRLENELSVIQKKDFSLYFLVLAEALGKIQEKYLTGIGRGSGAGSLLCYLLDITKIDPIKNNLLFERFLSENRTEAPDIDCDCEDRDGSLNLLKEHFGEESVVAISNYNTLQLKSLVKDISKFLKIPFEEVNEVTSKIELEAKPKILEEIGHDQKLYVLDYDNAVKHSETFAAFIQKYPSVGENIRVLFRQIKSIGKHAGGVCIVENADKNMPMIKIRGEYQTPWSEGLTAKHLEQFGLIKYDFLGLATLRIIRKCIENILSRKGEVVTFENIKSFYDAHLLPDIIGEGEEEVFKEIYHKGKFLSIFQFTERGVQDFVKMAKPLSVNDISTITALYRPGPLAGSADKFYLEAVDNPDIAKDEHPILQEILGPTKFVLCIAEGQKITLNNNKTSLIENIKIGDKIITGNGNIGNIIDVFYKGKKQVYKYNSNYEHSSLICTNDHKVRTIFGMEEINDANHLLRYRYQRSFINEEEIQSPYLLGLFVADGCGNKTNPVITCRTEEVAKLVSSLMSNEFGGIPTYYYNTRAWYASAKIPRNLQYKSNVITWLKKYNLWNKTKINKKTPENLLFASNIDIAKYLAGYVDGDGHIGEVISISCSYKENRLLLCNLLDILKITFYTVGHHIIIQDHDLFKILIHPHLLIKKDCKIDNKFCGEINVSNKQIKNFIDKIRKEEKIDKFFTLKNVSSNLYYKKMKSIKYNTLIKLDNNLINLFRGDFAVQNIKSFEDYGVQNTYDLSVDHEDHSFLAENYAVSNCFQEQFMLLSHRLAGFSLLESDELRKLLVKPVTSLGEEMKKKRIEAGDKFIKGCIKNGLSKERAERLWHKEIAGFISYGFAKAHSHSYAYISYSCAWLFYNYPIEWAAAVLENETNSEAEDKQRAISLVRSFGFNVKLPDINKSKKEWYITKDDEIVAPLSFIQNVGDKGVDEIIPRQPFTNIEQLLYNDDIDYRRVNKKVISALILCGALDDLIDNRFDNKGHFFEVCANNKPKTKKKFLEYLLETKGKCKDFTNEQIFLDRSRLLGYLDIDLLLSEEKRNKLIEYEIPSLSDFDIDSHKYCWAYVSRAETKISAKGNRYILISAFGINFDQHEILFFDKKGTDNYTEAFSLENKCVLFSISKSIGQNKWNVYDGKIKIL